MNDLLFSILQGLGIVGEDQTRADAAGYVKNLHDQLVSVRTRTYDQPYAQTKARTLIPVNNGDNVAAEKVRYYSWSMFGMAQLISNYADDLPFVSAFRSSEEVEVEGYGVAYRYTIMDIERAAMAGTPLSAKDSEACRRGFDQAVDAVAAQGEEGTELTGLANNPNVPIYAPTTGSWSGATPMQMAQDMIDLVYGVAVATDEQFIPNRVAMTLSQKKQFTAKPADTNSGIKSGKDIFDEISDYPVEFVTWHRLATMDAAGTGPRIVAYPYDSMVLELTIPAEYRELAPERRNMAFIVPTHGRVAGVIVYYAVAMGYMDGC